MSLDSKLNLLYECTNCSLKVPTHLLKLHSQSSPACKLFHLHNLPTQDSLKKDLESLISILSTPLKHQNFLTSPQKSFLESQKKIYQKIVQTNAYTIPEIQTLENFILFFRKTLRKKAKMLICDILLLFKKSTKQIQLKNLSIQILEKKTGVVISANSFRIVAVEQDYLAAKNQDNKVVIYNIRENSLKSVIYAVDKRFNCFILVPKFLYFVYLDKNKVCFWDYEKSENYRRIERPSESVEDKIYHSKNDRILILCTSGSFTIWDVHNLQIIQSFSCASRVKHLQINQYFRDFLYYSLEVNCEIWKVGVTGNEFIVRIRDVISLMPLTKNNNIAILIYRTSTDCEVIVYDTISKTAKYSIVLNFNDTQCYNFLRFIEDRDLILIKSLPIDLNSYSVINEKNMSKSLKYYYIRYKYLESKFKSIAQVNNISTEISEVYSNKTQDSLFALCSKSGAKYLLIHNLLTNSNSFFRISSFLTSLNLSTPNYIIFNYSQFFVYWNIETTQFDSVLYLDNKNNAQNKPLHIEFNLKKYNNDWNVTNNQYLVHSIKGKKRIEVLRLKKMKIEIFGYSEYPPLDLPNNQLFTVFKGWVRVLSLENCHVKGVKIADIHETCKFFYELSNFNVIISYSYRSIIFNTLTFEICAEARHDPIEKILYTESFSCIDAVVVHEISRVRVFLTSHGIKIIEINYKFSEHELHVKLTEDTKHLLFYNKKAMVVLHLETGQERFIEYNSDKVFIEKLKVVNSSWFILFVKPDNSVFTQITEKYAKIESNPLRFKLLIGNIQDPGLHAYFSYAEMPKVSLISSEFMLIYNNTTSFIIWMKDTITSTCLTSNLMTYIDTKSHHNKPLVEAVIDYIKSGSNKVPCEDNLKVVNFFKDSQNLVLLSTNFLLFIINLPRLSIRKYLIPYLQTGFEHIYYSIQQDALIIINSNSIKALSLTETNDEVKTFISSRSFSIRSCSISRSYICVGIGFNSEIGTCNLIIDLRSLELSSDTKTLTVGQINIFSLEDCFLFTQKTRITSMKTFSISKKLARPSSQKNYFEYFFVFKNLKVLDENKTTELRIFFDLAQKFLVLTDNDKFYIINTADLTILLTLGPAIISNLTCIHFSQSLHSIIFSNDQGLVYSFDLSTHSLLTFIPHLHPVASIHLPPSLTHILTSSSSDPRIQKTPLK